MVETKLSLREKICYALGDASANIAWRGICAFLMIYYTDVFGLAPAVVATLFFVVRLSDGVSDIAMGIIGDRTKSKHGKFRPWVLWTAIPLAVILSLVFTCPPGLGMTGKIIYAYVTYILFTLIYTANNIPYGALMAVMTPDDKERASIGSFRMAGAFAGGMLVQGLLLWLASHMGVSHAIYLLSAVMAVCMLATFYGTRERVEPPESQKTNLLHDLRDLVTNKPWLVLLVVGLFFNVYNAIRQGVTVYYFTHYVQRELLVGGFFTALMIAGLFCVCGKDYADLCAHLGKADEATRAAKAVAEMEKAVEKHGWDGEWYLRAYDFYGKKVGSKENDEGKIFIESQGWCGMAEIGKAKGLPEKALDATKKYLECEHGIVLNQPAFTKYVVEYGEISTYPAGYKENAGIFCHNNPWVIIAETLAGRGTDAWNHYAKICPSYTEEHSDLHKVEPYVYSQMIAGRDAAKPGEAKNSWLTGTAAWNWYAVSAFILGVKPDYDGLTIDPCIPKSWKGYTVTRRFRGATYTIEVKNPKKVEKGVASLTLDGKPINGQTVPFAPGRHKVVVTMGCP